MTNLDLLAVSWLQQCFLQKSGISRKVRAEQGQRMVEVERISRIVLYLLSVISLIP